MSTKKWYQRLLPSYFLHEEGTTRVLSVEFVEGTTYHWCENVELQKFIPEFKVDAEDVFFLKDKGKWVNYGKVKRLKLF